MRYWYVIYTIHNQEFRAEANLKKQGFQLYLPKYIGTRKIRQSDIIFGILSKSIYPLKTPMIPAIMHVKEKPRK